MPRRASNAVQGRRAPSQRQLRVGEAIRHALVRVLASGEVRDPDLAGVSITVTEVRVSPDLRRATAFVMPLGGERSDEVVVALGRAAPYLRRQIAGELTLKYQPDLQFEPDRTFDTADRIDALLRAAGHGETEPDRDGS